MKQLTSIEEMNEFVKQSGTHFLFKHSTTCPISAKAYDEFQAFVSDSDTSASVVYVIEHRIVSNQIADDFDIKHESPQVFLLEDGHVKWHTSHWKITKNALGEAFSS